MIFSFTLIWHFFCCFSIYVERMALKDLTYHEYGGLSLSGPPVCSLKSTTKSHKDQQGKRKTPSKMKKRSLFWQIL